MHLVDPQKSFLEVNWRFPAEGRPDAPLVQFHLPDTSIFCCEKSGVLFSWFVQSLLPREPPMLHSMQ